MWGEPEQAVQMTPSDERFNRDGGENEALPYPDISFMLVMNVVVKAWVCGHCSNRAVGTGPAAAGPIFGQPTRAKVPYKLWQVVQFLIQEYTSRDLESKLSYKIFLVGDGGKHALSPEERPHRSITVWGNYCDNRS